MALTALMLQVAALARCKPGQQLKDTLALSRPCSTQTVTGSKADKAADFMSELTTARTSNSSSCAASNSKPACVAEELVVPFDGLGVSFLQHLVQPLRPVLLRYHSVVEGLKHWRYSGQVLGVLSIPVGMYCTVNLVLARIGLPVRAFRGYWALSVEHRRPNVETTSIIPSDFIHAVESDV